MNKPDSHFGSKPVAGMDSWLLFTPTCRCLGWTSCPAACTTHDSLCTDTDKYLGSEAGVWDILRRTHSRTDHHPTAGQQGTTSPRPDLRTGIHLRENHQENRRGRVILWIKTKLYRYCVAHARQHCRAKYLMVVFLHVRHLHEAIFPKLPCICVFLSLELAHLLSEWWLRGAFIVNCSRWIQMLE